jgi:hypothetical protein
MNTKLLFTTRQTLHKLEDGLGISHLSESGKSIYALIASSQVTRACIQRHDYFKQYSLSTIKRVVDELISLGLIHAEPSKVDKRKKLLLLTRRM